MTKPQTSVPQPHPSLVRIGATRAFRVLLEEHRLSLATAKAVVARMRAAPRDRDEEGLTQLIKIVSAVKVSASYVGRATLREVAMDLEKLLDRQLLTAWAASAGVFDVLDASLDHMVAEMTALETGARAEVLDKNGLSLCASIERCLTDRPSALPGAAAFFEAFKEDSLRHLTSCREAIVAASGNEGVRTDALHGAFRAMHTLKGNAGLLGLADFEGMGRAIEQVLEGLRSASLVLTSNLSVALLDLLDVADAAVVRPRAVDFSREISALEVAEAEAKLVAQRTRLGDLLVESNLVTREQVDLVLAIKRDPLGLALMRLHALSETQLAQALELQRKLRAGDETTSMAPSAPRPKLVHVDAEKLERLTRRIDAALSAGRDASPNLRAELSALRDSVRALDRISLRNTFQRTSLLVSDLATQQQKIVQFAMRGEQTEIERARAAVLGDALLHLARNAVDHGIEPPAERVAKGKPQSAQIVLSALDGPEGIVIELSDDGRGIDRRRILQRAVAAGLLRPEQAEDSGDDQIVALVFAPGLSTAAGVTDISGRGVGMDVVKSGIEGVGGMVAIVSTPDRGTRVRITFAPS